MGGWKRIGIVLSVLWAAMVVGYAGYEYFRFPLEPFTIYLMRPDYTDYETAKGFHFIIVKETPGQEALSGAERAAYEKLIREAKSESERNSYIASRDLTQYSSDIAWGALLASIFIPLALAWGLFTVGIRTLAWVSKGFRVKS